MNLDKLTLHNIRSYDTETVSFPDGVTLLSGDIGSGKTSILLGVEFALFGLIRGSFSGASLLRHGADQGSVTLSFTVNDDDVTVHRELKRSSRGVRQDNGWYEVNGEREQATPREIKAEVIDRLGYPSSLVTKSKSMLYRYTVYTPQEEMKAILRESADERLEKIRKVLRLDKYKRVKENAADYARALKRDVKRGEDRLPDKAELDEEYERVQDALSDVESMVSSLEAKRDDVEESIDDVKDALDDHAESREALARIDKDLEAKKATKKALVEDVEDAADTIERKQDKIVDVEEPEADLPGKEVVVEKQDKVSGLIDELRERRSDLKQRRSVAESKIDDAEELIDTIEGMDTCPTCGQDVDDEHKGHVRDEQRSVIESAESTVGDVDEALSAVAEKLGAYEEKSEELENTLDAIKEHENKRKVYEEKKKRNEDLRDDVEAVQEEREDKLERLESVNDAIEGLKEERSDYDSLEDEIEGLEEKRDALQEKKEAVSSKLASATQKRKHLCEELSDVEDDIEEYEEAKQAIQRRRTTYTWLDDHFTNLLDVIEKHVLLSVHQRFDESFRSFFNDLIEDEALLADIDNDFTPRVTQQGYEMDVEDLSGGEKTSVALAYRLAMNDVINDYMHQVRTDDLIVLDEPTDGFSGEQLDRLRDILQGLRASQIILVSHEEKLEGVTEHLIEVRKANNKSEVRS